MSRLGSGNDVTDYGRGCPSGCGENPHVSQNQREVGHPESPPLRKSMPTSKAAGRSARTTQTEPSSKANRQACPERNQRERPSYTDKIRAIKLTPDQVHGCVVIVERDLQSLDVAVGESGREGFGEIDGVVGGLSSQTDHVNSRWNLDGFGVGAIDSVENNHVLPSASMERLGESQPVINPQ